MSNPNHDADALETRVRTAMHSSRQHNFAPGFEERALQRWRHERITAAAPTTLSLIEYRARRLLPLAVAASLILAVYSVRSGGDGSFTHSDIITRALGWKTQPVPDLFESVYGLSQSGLEQH